MEKKKLRKEVLARRNALSQVERREKSLQIADKVIGLEKFKKANKILLYAHIRSEVETTGIYNEAKKQGKDIYYPRVCGSQMEFYCVDDATEFEISAYGIQEPKTEPGKSFVPCVEDRIFVLMPGAVFDEAGNRIGYGGGYYDKYLQGLVEEIPSDNICKTAVAFDCQVVELGVIEKEPYDVQADYVVTESKVCCDGIQSVL